MMDFTVSVWSLTGKRTYIESKKSCIKRATHDMINNLRTCGSTDVKLTGIMAHYYFKHELQCVITMKSGSLQILTHNGNAVKCLLMEKNIPSAL